MSWVSGVTIGCDVPSGIGQGTMLQLRFGQGMSWHPQTALACSRKSAFFGTTKPLVPNPRQDRLLQHVQGSRAPDDHRGALAAGPTRRCSRSPRSRWRTSKGSRIRSAYKYITTCLLRELVLHLSVQFVCLLCKRSVTQ